VYWLEKERKMHISRGQGWNETISWFKDKEIVFIFLKAGKANHRSFS